MMNYSWNNSIDKGQYENGFVEVFETSIKEKKVIAIITYLPQFDDKNEQNVVLTLILQGEKDSWTKGVLNNIFYDVEDRIKQMENFKFRTFSSLDFMMTQIFYSNTLNDLNYLNSGEFTFIK